MIMERENLVGNKYGRLQVISYVGVKQVGKVQKRIWLCKCDCGNICKRPTDRLKSEKNISCGCLRGRPTGDARAVSGFSRSRLGKIYYGMKARCKSNPAYTAKGISVCEEWENPMAFYEWSMSHGYEDDLTLDRIDNSLGYSPNNCRWVDRFVQNNNTSKNKRIEVNGVFHTYAEWGRLCGLNPATIRNRYLYGVRGEKLLAKPRTATKGVTTN